MEEIYLMPDENNVFHQVEPIEIIPGRECEALNQAYQQGRADAIDEYMKYILAYKKLTREIETNDIYESVKIEFITDIHGRLKEQTNAT